MHQFAVGPGIEDVPQVNALPLQAQHFELQAVPPGIRTHLVDQLIGRLAQDLGPRFVRRIRRQVAHHYQPVEVVGHHRRGANVTQAQRD